MQHTTESTRQYRCRHIFTDGHRCASPCLRQEEFCYYHHTTRKPVTNPRQRRSRRSTFDLPLPADRSAIQASIGQVLQRIAANEIDPRRAGLLLYGLQIASLNLPKIQPHIKPTAEPQTVEEITIDPTLGILAPRTEVSEITTRKSAVAQLIERMMQTEEKPAPTPEPITIPTLQATADNLDLICSSPRNPKRRHFDRRRRTCRCSGEIRFSTSAVHNRISLASPRSRHSLVALVSHARQHTSHISEAGNHTWHRVVGVNLIFEVHKALVVRRDERLEDLAERHDSLTHGDLALFALEAGQVLHMHVV